MSPPYQTPCPKKPKAPTLYGAAPAAGAIIHNSPINRHRHLQAKLMNLRTHVVFEADFPEDGVWTPSGAVVQPSGLNIASALTEMLKHTNFEVSKPTSIESYGWDFTVSRVVWFVLQCPGPWLLLSENNGPLMQKIFNPKTLTLTHRDVLEKLNALLHHDGRFHNIRWFTREDYEKNKDIDRAAWSSEP